MKIISHIFLSLIFLAVNGLAFAMPQAASYTPTATFVQTSETMQLAGFKKEKKRTKKKKRRKKRTKKKKSKTSKELKKLKKRRKKIDRKKDMRRARDKRNDSGGIIDDETQRVRDPGTRSFSHGRDFLNGGPEIKAYHKKKRSKDGFIKKND